MEQIPKDVPVFRCTQHRTLGSSVWRFWCPWCRATHEHGAVAGHRVAHCPDGPFKACGYFLVGPHTEIAERAAAQE
jgi:hypothetical protein